MRKARLMLSPIAVLAVSFTLSAQTDEKPAFPKEFRRWAHVKSVLVGPQSVAFATEGGIHHIYANGKALEGYDSGKFPDGSVIVYDLLETKDVAGNTIEGPTRRVDVMLSDDLAISQKLANRFNADLNLVRGHNYLVEQSVGLYPTSGCCTDYAFSRHIVDPSKSKIYSFTIEWGRNTGNDQMSFQPLWPEMENIIQEVDAGLIGMPCDNEPTTEQVICQIRELARFFEELTDSIHEISAELVRLREELGIKESSINQWLGSPAQRVRSRKPN